MQLSLINRDVTVGVHSRVYICYILKLLDLEQRIAAHCILLYYLEDVNSNINVQEPSCYDSKVTSA